MNILDGRNRVIGHYGTLFNKKEVESLVSFKATSHLWEFHELCSNYVEDHYHPPRSQRKYALMEELLKIIQELE